MIPTRLAIACLAAFSLPVTAQQNNGENERHPVSVFKPRKVDGSVDALTVPAGFKVNVFAEGLLNPRILAVAPDGGVYVSRREQGDVLRLVDKDGDGKADGAPMPVANRPQAHGLAIHDSKLYLVTVKELFVADIAANGSLGPLTMLAGDLPDGGQHPNRTLAFGPDGMIYLSAGSTCNACNETNAELATMLRVSPDGKSRVIYATGLRNTIGFGWQPQTGELWGMDHGIDFLGDDQQPEELNKLELGKQYGWPHVFGKGDINLQSTPPGGVTKEEWKARSVPMAMGYTAHAAPMQMVFYNGGNFGADYQGDAFVAMRGSWNRQPASGYEVVRIDFDKGQPKSIEPFLTGFLTDGGQAHFARPVGLAQAADGSLLLGDDGNGKIYRIARSEGGKTIKPAAIPAGPMTTQAAKGVGVPLAMERLEAAGDAAISVRSPAFADAATIPPKFTEYADGVSPALSWAAVEGAKSYVVICEDPDAKPITPFVHWVAWNIPANVTALPEGLQEQLRLTDPDGLLQGKTSRNSIGYMGPKPPVGDPPHRYHFQVFALDTVLDVPAGSDRDAVLAAAKGHVLAEGVLVGTYQQTVKPMK